jgi:hypothetical protein
MAAMAFTDVTEFHLHMFALVPTGCFSQFRYLILTCTFEQLVLHCGSSTTRTRSSANVAVDGELAPGHKINTKLDSQTLQAINWN